MAEIEILRQVQITASLRGYRLFRNNTGQAWAGKPCSFCQTHMHPVRYGLAVGSSDLIGWNPSGLFTAFEVKTASGRPTVEQSRFIAAVIQAGGIGRIVRDKDDF